MFIELVCTYQILRIPMVFVARTLVCRVGFSRRLRFCLIPPDIG